MSHGSTSWEGEICPECRRGTIKVRANSHSGDMFYGCSNYPNCSASWNIDELNQWELPKQEKNFPFPLDI